MNNNPLASSTSSADERASSLLKRNLSHTSNSPNPDARDDPDKRMPVSQISMVHGVALLRFLLLEFPPIIAQSGREDLLPQYLQTVTGQELPIQSSGQPTSVTPFADVPGHVATAKSINLTLLHDLIWRVQAQAASSRITPTPNNQLGPPQVVQNAIVPRPNGSRALHSFIETNFPFLPIGLTL